MFLLVSVRHVGAHPDELQHGVSIQSSINFGKTFLRISRIRITPSTQILARVFVYLPPFISKILDFICRMVLSFILIYFEWRDSENQQFTGNFAGQRARIRKVRTGSAPSAVILQIVSCAFASVLQDACRRSFISKLAAIPLAVPVSFNLWVIRGKNNLFLFYVLTGADYLS